MKDKTLSDKGREIKIRKKDIKGKYNLNIDIKKTLPEDNYFIMIEVCPKCRKPTSIRKTTEAKEMADALDPKKTLTVSPLCDNCNPAKQEAPTKQGWEERELEHLAMNIVYQIGDELSFNIPVSIVDARQKTNDTAINFVMRLIKEHTTKALRSKDQEADKRVEEAVKKIEKEAKEIAKKYCLLDSFFDNCNSCLPLQRLIEKLSSK